MINESPLRQLAREYYEGLIDRAYYVEQRQRLIESLDDGRADRDSSQSTTLPGLFQTQGEAQPNSNDLADALANRDNNLSAAAGESEPDLHVTAPMERIETETLPEQSGSCADDTIAEAPKGSSLTLKLLLVLLLLAGCFLWLR